MFPNLSARYFYDDEVMVGNIVEQLKDKNVEGGQRREATPRRRNELIEKRPTAALRKRRKSGDTSRRNELIEKRPTAVLRKRRKSGDASRRNELIEKRSTAVLRVQESHKCSRPWL